MRSASRLLAASAARTARTAISSGRPKARARRRKRRFSLSMVTASSGTSSKRNQGDHCGLSTSVALPEPAHEFVLKDRHDLGEDLVGQPVQPVQPLPFAGENVAGEFLLEQFA